MRNVGTVALLISLAITGYLLWDTQQQLSSARDNTLHYVKLDHYTSALTLALLKYNNGKINYDSLLIVCDYYVSYLDSVTFQWEEKHEIHEHR